MLPLRTNSTSDSRLRVVFDDAVVSLRLAPDATLADVARALGELPSRHRSDPVGVDVRFAVPSGSAGPGEARHVI
jgi:hypothetical protein